MKEILIVFGGWARDSKTYKGLVKKTPVGWQTEIVQIDDLIKNGDVETFQHNTLRYLESHNFPQINLLGHSIGGAFALQFAYNNPQKVKRLLLVDSEGINAKETLPELTVNFLKATGLHGRKKLGQNLRAMVKLLRNPKTHIKLARYVHYLSIEKEARGLKVPTTIIWGEQDHLTPQSQGKRLSELIPNSKLIILKGLDHDWIIHQPQKFWDNLKLVV